MKSEDAPADLALSASRSLDNPKLFRFQRAEDSDSGDLISKYAEQPTNITEGVQSAYRSLSQNIKSAGQTILAVPMEVYEKSGKEVSESLLYNNINPLTPD